VDDRDAVLGQPADPAHAGGWARDLPLHRFHELALRLAQAATPVSMRRRSRSSISASATPGG
jgi:hypothetical protein